MLAISLVSVALVLGPDLVSLRQVSGLTDAGVQIDPLPNDTNDTNDSNDTSDPIAVAPGAASEFAADVFREIGPWEGETYEEIRAILDEARRESTTRRVVDL